jgi:tetratricopeptide (TPR) repeat protein
MPMSPDERLAAGDAAERAGDFVSARGAYEAALDDGDARTAADAHFHLGRLDWRQGRFDTALRAFERARAGAVRLGDVELRARVENAIGATHYALGSYAQARAAYHLALELTTDATMRAKSLLNLGVIENIAGDLTAARAAYAQSRAAFRQAGDEEGEALALHNLAMLHADAGAWEEAEEAYREALERFERLGNRQMVASVLFNRAEVLGGRGAHAAAVASCDLALAIYAELGDDVGRGEALRWKGISLHRLGQRDAAESCLREAMRIALRLRLRLLEGEIARALAELALERGDAHRARRWVTRARRVFTELDATRELAAVADFLARIE